MSLFHILDENKDLIPVPTAEGGAWFSNIDNRRVGLGQRPNGTWVSAVFLGLEHPNGMWFETLAGDEVIERYRTWAEAEAGHQRHITEPSSSG